MLPGAIDWSAARVRLRDAHPRRKTVTYTPASGPPTTLVGVLNYRDSDKPDPGVWGTLWVLQSDLTTLNLEPKKGDLITIDGETFALRGETWRNEDGAGGLFLWLRRRQ